MRSLCSIPQKLPSNIESVGPRPWRELDAQQTTLPLSHRAHCSSFGFHCALKISTTAAAIVRGNSPCSPLRDTRVSERVNPARAAAQAQCSAGCSPRQRRPLTIDQYRANAFFELAYRL